MKRMLKIIGIIILCIIIFIILLFSFLWVKNYINSKKPIIPDNYYTYFQSDAVIEQKYSQLGSYEVSSTIIDVEDKTIKELRIFYPTQLEIKNQNYPLIMITNASNTAASNYEPFFKRLASWGFIVVGNEDRQSGTGISTSKSLDYILELNANEKSLFHKSINEERIGIVGYSQGGAGAIRAVTEYDNSHCYKAMFTGSAAYAHLAKMWGGYDASKIKTPWFMSAATGSSDDLHVTDTTAEFGGVAPLSSLIENYNAITNDIIKLRARVKDAEHEDMLHKTDGYMTAWMLYLLQDDKEASKVFIGKDAEIYSNSHWQDIEKNIE